jgi:hypothetical protein
MSTVNLGAVWLNDANDLTDSQSFNNVTGLTFIKGNDGDVRALANGRLRLVTTTTTRRSYALTLELCTRTQVTWLEDHIGALVCARDDRGRKVYGTYFEVNVNENVARSDYADASVRFTEVTHSEAV